ncbi:Ger(x)C family spore germination protein [Bacillus sp. AK031]
MKKLIFAACIPLFLAGCVQSEILDDLNIETAKGFDVEGEHTITGTALFLRYMADKKIENITLSATALSTREVFNRLEKKSERPLVRGSLEVVIISDELAKKGILHVADSMQRDASIGARVLLLITNGNAGELLKGNYGIEGNSDYISSLVEHNIRRGDLSETNLHLFLFAYYQEGHTPYLPIINKVNDHTLELEGIVLFKKDKMIDTIPQDKMFFFKLLSDKYSEGSQVVKLNGEKDESGKQVEASINSLRSKHSISIDHQADPVKIKVDVELRGIIKEYTGKKLTLDKVKKIEEQMKKDIEEECNSMLKRFQDLGIDPMGLGQRQKHGIRGFDFKRWEEQQYPKADISVKADVEILEAGTVE